MDRREALRKGGLLAAGLVSGACSSKSPSPRVAPPELILPRVDVSRDRVIRTVVGLRPFRPPGFRVEKEKLGRKTLVHNYGHGGGGITLSWGTSHIAVEELYRGETGVPSRAAVLGAGALGLASARLLQARGVEVTMYAKDLPPHTTSNVAAGQWSPYSVSEFSKRSARFNEQFERAARLSHRYFQDLVGDYYGVRWLTNYVLSDHPFGGGGDADGIQDLFPLTRDLAPVEHPFPVQHVRQYVTMLIEPPVYLSAVMRDFLLAGGRVVVQELRSVEDVLSLPESFVVNATGLGAKALFDDQELVPVKGQLTFVLPQPEVDYITLYGDLYMMPRKDGILLGGTHERGNWSLDPDAAAVERIVDGHQKLFAAMR
jgi:glycine/D-amino acid oxidase-like deaminating enzyme